MHADCPGIVRNQRKILAPPSVPGVTSPAVFQGPLKLRADETDFAAPTGSITVTVDRRVEEKLRGFAVTWLTRFRAEDRIHVTGYGRSERLFPLREPRTHQRGRCPEAVECPL